LGLLLDPDLRGILKDAYFPAVDEAGEALANGTELSETTAEIAHDEAPAYHIRPLQAALYFENAEGFGEWRILVSDNATRQLREIRNSDKKKIQIVVKKIKQLSNGHFSDDNQKRLNRHSTGVPVFEAKMQRDLRLVYQVDCVPERDGEVSAIALIKLYGIYTHAQLAHNWDSVGKYLASKGKDYRYRQVRISISNVDYRCTFRSPAPRSGNDVFLPASFPTSTPQCDADPMEPLPASSGGEVCLFKTIYDIDAYHEEISNSCILSSSLIANEDVQHVFELSPQEHKVIDCTSSCYVLGRSGTGKTTTMLFKMLGIQRAWEAQKGSGMPKPRQIFVTKSHVLADKVEKYFQKLLASLATASCSLEELAKLKAPSEDSSANLPISQSGIPQSYSALGDHHFPLFITFDHLAQLIAADIFRADFGGDKHFAMLFQREALGTLITYKRFAKTYWPHLPQHLTKGLEPWLVFSEFMGVIKGSEQSLTCPNGFLDQETYCGLSERTFPTFFNQRETIYGLFEAYCNLKRKCGHHDMADRTHTILKALPGETSLRGQKPDYLYVDEAQDNLLIDALLLRRMCQNPDGLFWAGDTAQTISAGSAFRLDDLKAFLYRIEERGIINFPQRKPIPPTSFQLVTNYRSHGGIVKCANSVIELITHFWPYAIDKLRPEHGIVDGTKPLVIDGWDDVSGYDEFLFGGCEKHIEFGADQCILVRDDDEKEKLCQKLKEHIGNDEIGLIMTLYDSKGLEFNDVILYNFFESSSAQISQWRIVLNVLEDGESKEHAVSLPIGETKYGVICSELKRLYVGITRARQNLWIVDESTTSEPMRMFWTSRSLVEKCPLSDARDRLARFAVSSNEEEWAARGHSMLDHENYTEAKKCFSKARLPRMRDIAEAYELRENALNTSSGKVRQRAFSVAADKFTQCAGALADSKDKIKYHHLAAKCYDIAGDNVRAAVAFINAEEYDCAARQYYKGHLFDKTVKLLRERSNNISSECYEQLFTACRFHYCSQDIRPPFPLFPSMEDELAFLENYDLDLQRAKLLESLTRFSEAGEVYLTAKQPTDAVRAFKKDINSMGRAADILLQCLWRRCSFAISPSKVAKDEYVAQLLSLSGDLPLDWLSPVVRDEISMFQSIARADMPTLKDLADAFLYEHHHNAPALLAFDHTFSRLPPLESANVQEMSIFLHDFCIYSSLLYRVRSPSDPFRDKTMLSLFGISETDNGYTIEPGSALHRFLAEQTSQTSRLTQRRGPTSTRNEVTLALQQYLSVHLQKLVSAENSACCNAVAFSQCLTYIVNGQCDRQDCLQNHLSLSSLDSKQYNAIVSMHLKQMRILQFMFSANPGTKRLPTWVDWLNYIYEAIFPPFYVLGTIADLDMSKSRDGERILKEWIQDAIYSLDPSESPEDFLTVAIRLIKLALTFDEKHAVQYLADAYFIVHDRPELLHVADGSYILQDILTFMEGRDPPYIAAGVKALHFMLQNSSYVNLSVLCDYAEDICSSIILLYLRNSDQLLHNIILPRRWLMRLKNSAGIEQSDCAGKFLESMRLLLRWLRSDDVEGYRSSRNPETTNSLYLSVIGLFWLTHTSITSVHRNLFTSRM
ncbi:hypothetical protein F5I97DRAFT_1811384, partial [Phlebopus sp. FC_14]